MMTKVIIVITLVVMTIMLAESTHHASAFIFDRNSYMTTIHDIAQKLRWRKDFSPAR